MNTKYRPELDGLRAIAVLGVFFYHADLSILGSKPFKGGFIGVDIFFVISGYLITSIIFKEKIITGTFSLKNFYERRARRILPALLTVMMVSFIFAWLYLLPSDLVSFSKSVIFSLGFISNFYFFYSGQLYGAESGLLKPLLHTWSLSVEEQFYIFFPILMMVFITYYKKKIPYFILTGIFISLCFAAWGSKYFVSATFYLMHSRIWEILFGSFLSYLEIKRPYKFKNKILSKLLPSFGLILILLTIIFFKLHFNHPSFYTLPSIIGTCLIIRYSNSNEITYKLLSSRLLVGIGLISYSLYLWHYPIFSFLKIIQINRDSILTNLVIFISIFIVSIISYFFIEKPFRNKKYKFYNIFLIITLITLILFSLSSYTILKNGTNKKLPPILSKNLYEKPWLLLKNDQGQYCHNSKNGCDFNGHSKNKVFLIGDSHAGTLMFDLKNRLVKKNYRFITSTQDGCIYLPGFNRLHKGTRNIDNDCNNDYFNSLKEKLSKQENSIIIISGMFQLYLNNYSFFDNEEGSGYKGVWQYGEFVPIKKNNTIEATFKDEIEQLSINNQIILIYPIPETGWNIPRKIYTQWIKRDKKLNKDFFLEKITTSHELYKKRSSSTFELFNSIDNKNIFRVYPSSLFCNTSIKGRCMTHDQNDIYYSDNNHPSNKGAEIINDLILQKIEEINFSKISD
jgi:peptidoglycan/LPS O-acetylase OafA/YrhL